jgi:CheY-like chemotaxis protein
MERTGGVLEIILRDCEISQRVLQQNSKLKPGAFVVLSVSDTGTGIAPDIQGKIFDPYFTTKGVGKGTGMGLSIVHGIVTSHGGFVTSENNPGNGSVFQVYFPVHDNMETSSDIRHTEMSQSGAEHILLVDDETMLAELGKVMFERLGYKVTMLTNSLEALTIFENQPERFDVVITDQTMPGITGMDMAKLMLKIRPDIPIILCTGYSTLVSEEHAKAEGIAGFAMKPLSKRIISTLLRKVLDDRMPS